MLFISAAWLPSFWWLDDSSTSIIKWYIGQNIVKIDSKHGYETQNGGEKLMLRIKNDQLYNLNSQDSWGFMGSYFINIYFKGFSTHSYKI